MSENTPSKQSRLQPFLIVATAGIVLASAAIVSWKKRELAATFQFGEDKVKVMPFDEVPMFDAMTLHLDMPFAGYVYVVSFDYERGAVCYYPTDFLGTDHLREDNRMNFFPAGHHELPGTWDGKEQSWYVPDSQETHSFCVVVSKKALLDLEGVLALTRQVGNKAFPNRSMGMYMPRAGKAKVIGRKSMPHDILKAAMNQKDSVHAGPMVPCQDHEGVFVKVLNIRPGKPRPGAQPPENPFSARLKQVASDKLLKKEPAEKDK